MKVQRVISAKSLKKLCAQAEMRIAAQEQEIAELKRKLVEKQTKRQWDIYKKAKDQAEKQRVKTYLALRGKGWLKKDKVRIKKIKGRQLSAALELVFRKHKPSSFKVNPESFRLYDLKGLYRLFITSRYMWKLKLISFRDFRERIKKADVPKIGNLPKLYTSEALSLVFPDYNPIGPILTGLGSLKFDTV